MAQIKSSEVADALRARVDLLIPVRQRLPGRKYKYRLGGGQKPMARRRVFSAIVYDLRTGCQWKGLPKVWGSASAIHDHFQQSSRAGFILAPWRSGPAEYDDMEGTARDWQSADGAMGKALLVVECVGANPRIGEKRLRQAWHPTIASREQGHA